MTLTQGEENNAIYDKFDWGPVFGNGFDLYIANKCNQNSDSGANFPSSYNRGSKYQYNQQSWTLFSGATNGYKFKVVEYEVFEVVKWANDWLHSFNLKDYSFYSIDYP
jgi:hypothetical protein